MKTACFASLVALLGCASGQTIAPSAVACAPPTSPSFFFPEGTFQGHGKDTKASARTRAEYSKYLHVVAEPSLSCGDLRGETFRFFWIPSPVLVRNRLAVRVTFEDDVDGTAILVEVDDREGSGIRRASRRLTEADVSRVQRAIRSSNFWNIPTTMPRMGHDGDWWIVEGRSGGRYHAVERWSPDASEQWTPDARTFLDLCLLMLELGGIPADRVLEDAAQQGAATDKAAR